jgi:hemin uptake protein HemP
MPLKKPVVVSVLRQAGHDPGSPNAAQGVECAVKGEVRYRIDELLKGGREAILVHRGQEYRLRITATGKLILTK